MGVSKLSLHLLPVRAFNIDSYPIDYKNYLPTVTSSTLYSCITTVSHGILYIGHCIQTSDFRLYKINTITNTFAEIGTISWLNMGSRYAGAILVDDFYLYISATNRATIRIFRLEDLSLVTECQYSTSSFQAYGKMQWWDEHTICIAFDKGFLFFDTTKREYTYRSQSTSYTSQDMCVGNEMIVANRSSTNSTSVFAYKPSTDTFSTFAIASSERAVSCYENGFFFFVDKSYVTIYNESDGTITTKTGLWSGYNTNPRSVNIYNGCLFITFCDSPRVYIYDLTADKQTYMNARWSIPTWNTEKEYIPCTVGGKFYLPYITLLVIDFSGTYKYNIGKKYEQFAVMYNETNEPSFEYDPRYISFTESYMTMIDGSLEYDMAEYDPENNIKSVMINKDDYGVIKKLYVSRKEEIDDGE